MSPWKKLPMLCAECAAPLMRRPLRPKDGRQIERFYCNRSCKEAWQLKNLKPAGVTAEWLRAKYVREGLDCAQIAALVGRDSKSVWNWLKGFEIPTRARGHNKAVHFQAGKNNGFAGRKHSDETRAKQRAAALLDGRVPYGKGNEPYWKGRFGAEHPSWKGGHTPERQAFYASAEWRKASRAVRARAGNSCERCGVAREDLGARRFHIHHIVSFSLSVEMRAEPSNLALLCDVCHRWVHSKANGTRAFLEGAA